MKTLQVRAVIITDGEGYFIHGTHEEAPDAMFKAMSPIWGFDPSKETVHYVELTVTLPDFEEVIEIAKGAINITNAEPDPS